MIVTPGSSVVGYRVTCTLGLVRGSTIRARHLGKDVLAVIKNMIGGEIEGSAQIDFRRLDVA